jgi:hypothetical protein
MTQFLVSSCQGKRKFDYEKKKQIKVLEIFHKFLIQLGTPEIRYQ